MNEIDAIHLSESHGLGSPNNTLVPGVAVPAYTPGTDPNKWISTVKAIGLARLQPSQSGYSLYKPVADVVGSLPGYSGLANTTIQRKSPEEQAQVVAKLAEVLAGSGTDDGRNRFASGNWIFGNDFGGMQSAKLADDAQEFREVESNRNFNLQSAAQAFNQRLAEQQLARQSGADAWTRSQATEQNRLSLLDRLNALSQQQFTDQLNLAQITGNNAYTTTYNSAGNSAVQALDTATKQLTPAQQAYNNRLFREVETYNATLGPNALPESRLVVTEGPNGIAKLQGGKQAGAGLTHVSNIMATSPEGSGLQSAFDAVQSAQLAMQKVPFTPRPTVSTPAPPNFNTAPLIQMLEAAGYKIQAPKASKSAAKSGAVGYFDPKTGTVIRY